MKLLNFKNKAFLKTLSELKRRKQVNCLNELKRGKQEKLVGLIKFEIMCEI